MADFGHGGARIAWAGLVLGLSGCLANDTYPCSLDSQCSGTAQGEGRCLGGWCAYQDDSCETAWRYSENAGGGNASACFLPSAEDASDDTSSDAPVGSTGDTTSTSTVTSAESSGTSSSSDGGETADPCAGVRCQTGQTCVGGICVGDPDEEPACSPMAGFGRPCNACALENCCDPMEECFGVVGVDESTPLCGQLAFCLSAAAQSGKPEVCAGPLDEMTLQACIDAACSEFAAAYPAWLEMTVCITMDCPQTCGSSG